MYQLKITSLYKSIRTNAESLTWEKSLCVVTLPKSVGKKDYLDERDAKSALLHHTFHFSTHFPDELQRVRDEGRGTKVTR